MPSFHVEWAIEIEAETPEAAAREALRMQRDPDSWATCFTVLGPDRLTTEFDFGMESIATDTLNSVTKMLSE